MRETNWVRHEKPSDRLTKEPVDQLFRIKPLEWEDRSRAVGERAEFYDEFVSCTPYGSYTLYRWPSRMKTFVLFETITPKDSPADWFAIASPEEGKQLAEQHWEAYIKQALIEVELETLK